MLDVIVLFPTGTSTVSITNLYAPSCTLPFVLVRIRAL
jgi:hypothetical protein